jgi:hypothetical protein
MRKLFSCMVTIAIIATIALLPVEGYSEPKWRLYDDFEYGDGDPDPDRWDVLVDELSESTISIENGMAKFVHFPSPVTPDPPRVANFLIIMEKPEKIKGIRVTVTVEELNEEDVGDLLGGTAGFIGNVGDGWVLDHLYIQAQAFFQKIFCGLAVCNPLPDIVRSLFYGEFSHPI